jgi:hypothetical protein
MTALSAEDADLILREARRRKETKSARIGRGAGMPGSAALQQGPIAP